MKPNVMVGAVVSITVGLLLIGYLLPIGYTAYHDDSKSYTTTLTTAGGITTIGQGVTINLTAVNSGANATLALYEMGVLVDTQLINLDATGTFAAPGGSITVTPTAIDASTTIDVAIPANFRWDDGEVGLFSVLGVLVLIGLMLAFVGMAMKAFE